MRLTTVLLLLGLLPSLAVAQSDEIVIDISTSVVARNGAILRGLDRINGTFEDIEIAPGQIVQYERLEVELLECRYPADQEATEAFANLRIKDMREDLATFAGWMFASSPALSALDHPRYDVWVLRCNI